MTRRTFFSLAVPLTLAPLTMANHANGDPRLEKLYSQYMSPCCWAETLLVHNSPIASQLRADIRRWIADGKTGEQIKSVLIERYTIRILAMPEGARLRWLFWTPIAAMTAGLAGLFACLRRLRAAPADAGGTGAELPDVEPNWDIP